MAACLSNIMRLSLNFHFTIHGYTCGENKCDRSAWAEGTGGWGRYLNVPTLVLTIKSTSKWLMKWNAVFLRRNSCKTVRFSSFTQIAVDGQLVANELTPPEKPKVSVTVQQSRRSKMTQRYLHLSSVAHFISRLHMSTKSKNTED